MPRRSSKRETVISTLLFQERKPHDLFQDREPPNVLSTPYLNAEVVIDSDVIEIYVKDRGQRDIGMVTIVLAGEHRGEKKGSLLAWLYDTEQCDSKPPLKPQEVTLATWQRVHDYSLPGPVLQFNLEEIRYLMPKGIGYNLDSGNYTEAGVSSRGDIIDCMRTWFRDECPDPAPHFIKRGKAIMDQVMGPVPEGASNVGSTKRRRRSKAARGPGKGSKANEGR